MSHISEAERDVRKCFNVNFSHFAISALSAVTATLLHDAVMTPADGEFKHQLKELRIPKM